MASTKNIKDIDQLQLEAYRRMTGEDRLRIGLGLYEAALSIAREAIRNRSPDADAATVEEKLRARIRAGYEIQSLSEPKSLTPAPVLGSVRGQPSLSSR